MNLFARWLILSLLIIPIATAKARAQGSFLDELRLKSYSDLPEESFTKASRANGSPSFLPNDPSDRLSALEPNAQFNDPRIIADGDDELLTHRALLDNATSLAGIETSCTPEFGKYDATTKNADGSTRPDD